MALVQCGECKAEMSERAKQCPACGWRRPRSKRFWALIAAGALFTFIMLVGHEHNRQVRIEEMEKEVAACWVMRDIFVSLNDHSQVIEANVICANFQKELDALRGR